MIIVHSQLIRFPDIAFFTSPIPLHIAAMVILYGHISRVDCLPPPIALEDVWLALDMIPRFRWRWERKDANGGHPLISKLVETIMRVNLHAITPSNKQSVLYCETDWEEVTSPASTSTLSTPIMASPHSAYPGNGNGDGAVYGPHARAHNGAGGGMNRSTSGGSTPPDRLADMPQGLLYPFYPEAEAAHLSTFSGPGGSSASGDGASAQGAGVHAYDPLLKQVAALQGGYGGYAADIATHGDPRQQQQQGQHSAPPVMWTHVSAASDGR